MDGQELCKRIRCFTERRDGYPFFIFLTTLDGKARLLEGMQAGADDYLLKPLDRDELRARLLAASRVTSLHKQLSMQKKELERLNLELFEQARLDPLTRLGNRLRLREDLETLNARVKRYRYSYCAILCDIDFFKLYNDVYGHLAGDEMLERIANVIYENLRTGDTAYRYGGEEFLIILPEQTLKPASVTAERLRRTIEHLAIPHEAVRPGGIVTVSCGLAELSPDEEKTTEELIKEADDALYKAKERGKNNVALHARRAPAVTGEPEADRWRLFG
jgi:diguanylate cyclase (GGDEF)-like protein